MRNRPIAALAALTLALAGAGCGDDDETTTVTAAPQTTSTTSTSSTSSTTTSSDSTTTDSTTTTTEAGEDVSGNCDEAEHADDPECSGGVEAPDDDNSGPG